MTTPMLSPEDARTRARIARARLADSVAEATAELRPGALARRTSHAVQRAAENGANAGLRLVTNHPRAAGGIAALARFLCVGRPRICSFRANPQE